MKTFYYSIATVHQDWEDEKQYEVTFESWLDFAHFCLKLAESMNTIIRGCSSVGYNNQGSYFHRQ